MSYLYKLVTTENIEINYDAFKKKELIEGLATMRDIYFSLKQENKQLKENYERIYNENCKLREEHNITDINLLDENYKLKDNWNKLKEIAKSQSGFKKRADLKGGLWFEIDELLDKMQELERGISDVED